MTTYLNEKIIYPINITWVYQPYRIVQQEDGELKVIQVGWPHTTSHGAYRALEATGCDEEEYHVRSIPLNRDTDLERTNALHFN